jgi:hypothetical protein
MNQALYAHMNKKKKTPMPLHRVLSSLGLSFPTCKNRNATAFLSGLQGG